MGIVNLFTSVSNLPYITSTGELLRVQDIVQESYISVDEKGKTVVEIYVCFDQTNEQLIYRYEGSSSNILTCGHFELEQCTRRSPFQCGSAILVDHCRQTQ